MIVPAYPVSALPFQSNSLLQAMNLQQTNKHFFKNSKQVHFSSCLQNKTKLTEDWKRNLQLSYTSVSYPTVPRVSFGPLPGEQGSSDNE